MNMNRVCHVDGVSYVAVFVCLAQVGVSSVDPQALEQALAADVITFGSPSAVK
jgi:hypothetical protein